MPRRTPGYYVPLDVNYPRDAAIRRAGEHAELLFVRSLAYCKGAGTGGFVPDYDIDVVAVGLRSVPARVAALVRERLWIETEGGWVVRSFERWNAKDGGHAEAGARGNHVRWHVNHGRPDPDCEWCRESQDESPPDSHSDSQGESPGDTRGDSQVRDREKREANASLAERPEVEALCIRLADRIEANGSKRPTIGKTWLDAARRMIDIDGRDPAKAATLIDWCQQDRFWRSNILSMPTFREKYDQVRLKAIAEWERGRGSSHVSPDGQVDVDAVLGHDLWSPPPPPDDLEPGTPAYREWHAQQRAERKAQREAEARAVLERRGA